MLRKFVPESLDFVTFVADANKIRNSLNISKHTVSSVCHDLKIAKPKTTVHFRLPCDASESAAVFSTVSGLGQFSQHQSRRAGLCLEVSTKQSGSQGLTEKAIAYRL